MAEPGCLHDAHFQNLEVSGDTTLGPITSNYLRFVTGEYFGMTVVAKSDIDTDTGFTLQANAITESLWDGGGAASSMVLPSATKDTICVFRFAAAAAGGNTIIFTTASGDTYDVFSLHPPAIGGEDLVENRGARCLPSPTYGTTTNLVSAVTANNKFSVAATANNNQTNIGAELVWYCKTDGEWLMAFVPSFLGSGLKNETFAFS
jgi:hypothetical protein